MLCTVRSGKTSFVLGSCLEWVATGKDQRPPDNRVLGPPLYKVSCDLKPIWFRGRSVTSLPWWPGERKPGRSFQPVQTPRGSPRCMGLQRGDQEARQGSPSQGCRVFRNTWTHSRSPGRKDQPGPNMAWLSRMGDQEGFVAILPGLSHSESLFPSSPNRSRTTCLPSFVL